MSVPGLADALERLARQGEIISYGALARQLCIPGPGAIAQLTAALEASMAEDAAMGKPFRAVLCAGKLNDGMPASGFFEVAARLGRFSGPDQKTFVAAERHALFNRN